jgi:hypothetical protein
VPEGQEFDEYAGLAAVHSWWEHAKEFPNIRHLKYEDAVDAMSNLAYDILIHAEGNNKRVLDDLRTAYYDDARGVLVLLNKKDGGIQSTIFKADRHYFETLK